jgi:hypothetical protein
MLEVLNFIKGATIIKLNAAATNLNVGGNFNVPLRER